MEGKDGVEWTYEEEGNLSWPKYVEPDRVVQSRVQIVNEAS